MTLYQEGPRDARIIAIGEGPGAQEIATGRPFVGPAGQTFDGILAAAGIERSSIFITNITHEMPNVPRDEKDRWFFPGGAPSQVYLDGIKQAREDILDIRSHGGGNVIVPMGNYALWGVFAETHIAKWRGSILSAKLVPGVKTIPTLHPQYINQSWKERPLSVWDWQRIAEESASPEIVLPHRTFYTDPTPTEIEWAVSKLLADGARISFDIECYDADHIICIGYTNDPEWAICIPFNRSTEWAHRALLESSVPKVCQNAMFECTILPRIGFPVNGRVDDTMVAHHYCWPELGAKDLGTITSIYTREPFYKDELKIWGQTRDYQTLATYNCKDVCVTLEAWRVLEGEEMPYCKTRTAYDIPMKIFGTMAQATVIGIRADRERFQELRTYYDTKATDLETKLSQVVGYDINLGSPKQVAELVYDQMGVRVTAEGRTTKQEVLMEAAINATEPAIKTILTMIVRCRHLKKIRDAYLHELMIDPDGRIRCAWNLAGTENGRLSAGTTYWGSGTSLQTIPDEAVKNPGYSPRSIYIPDEGYVFVGHDYDQAEARIVAYLTEDDELIEWMESGIDIHRKLASLLPFGLTYEELLAMPKDCKERYLAKKCRHGLNYQMGFRRFKTTVNKEYAETGVGLTEREAKALRIRYMEIHPKLQLWWKSIESELSRNSRMLTNALGRVRRFTQRWGEELFKDATAFYPQSTVGDLTTLGIARAAEAMPWSVPLIHAHDGSVFQVPVERAAEATAIIREAMTMPIRVRGETMVIPVSVYQGPNWSAMEKVRT